MIGLSTEGDDVADVTAKGGIVDMSAHYNEDLYGLVDNTTEYLDEEDRKVIYHKINDSQSELLNF